MDEAGTGARAYALVTVALPHEQVVRTVMLEPGMTIVAVVERSGILAAIGGNLHGFRIGIYGKLKPLDTIVRDRDRIEVYRPLVADPKESRRRRAEKRIRDQAPRARH